jgi:hypothetical protein
LAAKANGAAIQTPDPTFSKATRDSTGQPPGAAAVRIHLVQLADQPATLTDTLRTAGRLDYRWNTGQLRAPPRPWMRATTGLLGSSKPDAWTLAMTS